MESAAKWSTMGGMVSAAAWATRVRAESTAKPGRAAWTSERRRNGCYNFWFGMNIVSRYLLKQHAVPFVFALSAVTGIMLLNQIAKRLGDLLGKGLPGGVIVEVFALSIPFIVAMTLPMAVLVAVLHTFTHLAADNEVTAMKASGISVGRILLPVLGGATLIALIAFVWNDQILPRSNHELRTLLVDIQRKKPTFQLREQVINEVVAGQFFLRAARIDPANNALS